MATNEPETMSLKDLRLSIVPSWTPEALADEVSGLLILYTAELPGEERKKLCLNAIEILRERVERKGM